VKNCTDEKQCVSHCRVAASPDDEMVTPVSNNIAPRPGSPGVQHRYNNFYFFIFSRAAQKEEEREEMKAVSSSGLSS